jgi:hypothetical protein
VRRLFDESEIGQCADKQLKQRGEGRVIARGLRGKTIAGVVLRESQNKYAGTYRACRYGGRGQPCTNPIVTSMTVTTASIKYDNAIAALRHVGRADPRRAHARPDRPLCGE